MSFIPGRTKQRARTMDDKSEPLEMNQTHDRIPQKISSQKRVKVRRRRHAWSGEREARAMPLPARDGKSRADARIPSKRAIRRERGEMETARGKRENEQRVKERCHLRLPTNSTTNPNPHQHTRQTT